MKKLNSMRKPVRERKEGRKEGEEEYVLSYKEYQVEDDMNVCTSAKLGHQEEINKCIIKENLLIIFLNMLVLTILILIFLNWIILEIIRYKK